MIENLPNYSTICMAINFQFFDATFKPVATTICRLLVWTGCIISLSATAQLFLIDDARTETIVTRDLIFS